MEVIFWKTKGKQPYGSRRTGLGSGKPRWDDESEQLKTGVLYSVLVRSMSWKHGPSTTKGVKLTEIKRDDGRGQEDREFTNSNEDFFTEGYGTDHWYTGMGHISRKGSLLTDSKDGPPIVRFIECFGEYEH